MAKGSGRRNPNADDDTGIQTSNTEGTDMSDTNTENATEAAPQAPRPDAAARAGVTVQRTITATAPNKEAVAAYFDAEADDLDAAHGGEATGRGAGTRARAQGEAAGLRKAAEFLRGVTITG